MRKTLLVISSILALCTTAMAQETFVPGFHWAIKGGAGYTVNEATKEKIATQITPAAAIDLGWQFTPWFTLRGDISGWKGTGYYNTNNWYVNYAQLAIDGKFNLIEIFEKQYKSHIVKPYLFVGVGGQYRFKNTATKEMLPGDNLLDQFKKFSYVGRLGAGIDFQVCKSVAIELEFAENATDDSFNSKKGDVFDHQMDLLLGLNFSFGQAKKMKAAAQTSANDAAAAAVAAAGVSPVVANGLVANALTDAQAKAESAVKAASKKLADATEAWKKAYVKVDDNGNATPCVFEGLAPELAATYAAVANNEVCPDFTAFKKKDNALWNKEHADILPANWKKMSADEKNQFVNENIYAPVVAAKAQRAQAYADYEAALASMKEACAACDNAVVLAQSELDNAAKAVDANGNVTPACFAGVAPELAQKYADIANSESCLDFAKMTKKENKVWTKAHSDILPENWKKMTFEERTIWYRDAICTPAAQAKANKNALQGEVACAKARKANQDAAFASIQAPEFIGKYDELTKATMDAAAKGDVIGFFTINKTSFNTYQLAVFKGAIKNLDKNAAKLTVTGYADQETGSEAKNAQLRVARSAYIKNLLKQYGFTGSIKALSSGKDGRYIDMPVWENRCGVVK